MAFLRLHRPCLFCWACGLSGLFLWYVPYILFMLYHFAHLFHVFPWMCLLQSILSHLLRASYSWNLEEGRTFCVCFSLTILSLHKKFSGMFIIEPFYSFQGRFILRGWRHIIWSLMLLKLSGHCVFYIQCILFNSSQFNWTLFHWLTRGGSILLGHLIIYYQSVPHKNLALLHRTHEWSTCISQCGAVSNDGFSQVHHQNAASSTWKATFSMNKSIYIVGAHYSQFIYSRIKLYVILGEPKSLCIFFLKPDIIYFQAIFLF